LQLDSPWMCNSIQVTNNIFIPNFNALITATLGTDIDFWETIKSYWYNLGDMMNDYPDLSDSGLLLLLLQFEFISNGLSVVLGNIDGDSITLNATYLCKNDGSSGLVDITCQHGDQLITVGDITFAAGGASAMDIYVCNFTPNPWLIKLLPGIL